MTQVTTAPLAEVICTLTELLEDTTISKSLRNAITQTMETLERSPDRVAINRALSLLEDAADNVNMQPDHRSLLFNVVSMLETV